MLREFNRSSRLDGMMQAVLNLNSGEYESARQLIKKILQGGEKDRGGTIEDAASDELSAGRVQVGTIAQTSKHLADVLHVGLFNYYNRDQNKLQ
ncbi:hypothetical protein C0995_003447, partial [Termitomyces sp. Mi166